MSKLVLCLSVLFLCGCWQYSGGTTVGYVTTVEGGVFWDTVFVRADYTSSQTDGYAIRKENRELKGKLLQSSLNKKRVEITYSKHMNMARMCEASCPSDEIISFKELE